MVDVFQGVNDDARPRLVGRVDGRVDDEAELRVEHTVGAVDTPRRADSASGNGKLAKIVGVGVHVQISVLVTHGDARLGSGIAEHAGVLGEQSSGDVQAVNLVPSVALVGREVQRTVDGAGVGAGDADGKAHSVRRVRGRVGTEHAEVAHVHARLVEQVNKFPASGVDRAYLDGTASVVRGDAVRVPDIHNRGLVAYGVVTAEQDDLAAIPVLDGVRSGGTELGNGGRDLVCVTGDVDAVDVPQHVTGILEEPVVLVFRHIAVAHVFLEAHGVVGVVLQEDLRIELADGVREHRVVARVALVVVDVFEHGRVQLTKGYTTGERLAFVVQPRFFKVKRSHYPSRRKRLK